MLDHYPSPEHMTHDFGLIMEQIKQENPEWKSIQESIILSIEKCINSIIYSNPKAIMDYNRSVFTFLGGFWNFIPPDCFDMNNFNNIMEKIFNKTKKIYLKELKKHPMVEKVINPIKEDIVNEKYLPIFIEDLPEKK